MALLKTRESRDVGLEVTIPVLCDYVAYLISNMQLSMTLLPQYLPPVTW